ncbi:MAG: hypothetical protein II059_04010 [Clostridia bacterium]|nr:hypothetical protein [Clostridia bacterium]
MNVMKRRNVIALILSLLTIFVITGCSAEGIKRNDKYVASVKSLVNDVVNLNRVFNEQDKNFNCHDPESIEKITETMDTLSQRFDSILKLQAENEFREYDQQLKNEAKQALQIITQLRTLVKYSETKLDDKLYQNEKEELIETYKVVCGYMREISSEVQTYWRNA